MNRKALKSGPISGLAFTRDFKVFLIVFPENYEVK